MTNAWTDTLTTEQLEAYYTLTAKIDPAFAARDRKFWETRSYDQCNSLMFGAWQANNSDMYLMARSYRARSKTNN